MFHHFENDWSVHHFTENKNQKKEKQQRKQKQQQQQIKTLHKTIYLTLNIRDVTPSQH